MQHPPMTTLALIPSAELRPYIRRFLVVEYFAGHSTTLLPGAGVVAAFRFKGNALVNGTSAAGTMVTGLWDTTRTLTHSGNCSNVLAMFTPTGAAAFLREPVDRFFNSALPLDLQVRRSRLDLVEEQVAEATHNHQRVLAVEKLLREHLSPRPTDGLIAAAIARIRSMRGTLRIESLARFTGLSQSTLERRFRREVGASPKKFASILRLRHVVHLRRKGASFTQIAHAAGYADQSHFNKDFKRFAGQAPEEFFQSPNYLC